MNFSKREWLRWSSCVSCTAIAAMFLSGKVLAQAVERPDLSIELIDPKVLRVCADPSNMPFSTAKGEGFENKLAELVANKLGKGLSYSFYPQAPGFVRNTLGAHKCDVMMGVPQGDDIVQVTNPYYRTAYALVFKQGHGLEDVDTLGDPRLKDQTHWHRGRDASWQQHGSQWSHGQCQALPAGRRHPRRFLGRRDDA